MCGLKKSDNCNTNQNAEHIQIDRKQILLLQWNHKTVWVYVGNIDVIKRKIQQGAVSIRKTVLPGMAIPMLKKRRPNGRLIFNMEIAIRR